MHTLPKRILRALTVCGMMLASIGVPLQTTAEEEVLCLEEGTTVTATPRQEDTLYNYMLRAAGGTPMPDPGRRRTVRYAAGITAGDSLTGNDALVYAYLKEKCGEIAAGKVTETVIDIPYSALGIKEGPWSAEELGVSTVYLGGISNAARDALFARCAFDHEKIMDALLTDCPYEMYWVDISAYHVQGVRSLSAQWDKSDLQYKLYLGSSPRISLYVSADYSETGAEFTSATDPEKVAAVSRAVDNAKAIVARHSDKSGRELLEAYREEICALTSYNNAVAMDPDAYPYGDPWQLVYVFDGDETTDVVCEGYAKAFKFLCDLSADRLPGISCLIVSGVMVANGSGGDHMWNLVHMDDDRSYLVDVTNCDEQSIGYPDLLFLAAPASGSLSSGYTFQVGSRQCMYQYSEDTTGCFTASYLTLSDTPYVKPDIPIATTTQPTTTITTTTSTTTTTQPTTTISTTSTTQPTTTTTTTTQPTTMTTTTTQPITTTSTTTTTTQSTTATEATTVTETKPEGWYAPLDQLKEMVRNDYEGRHEGAEVRATVREQTEELLVFEVLDAEGTVLDVYTIDMVTAMGVNQEHTFINLPQTGVTSPGRAAAAGSAAALTIVGAWLAVRSRRRE